MWVVTPGARRRVFYFAVVISGSGEWEVPQGISEASRRATKTRSKIPEETGAELEGKFARRRTGKSRQTSPEAFRAFRSTRKKGSLTTERLASPRRQLCADYGPREGMRVWVITSLLEIEHNCGTRRLIQVRERLCATGDSSREAGSKWSSWFSEDGRVESLGRFLGCSAKGGWT